MPTTVAAEHKALGTPDEERVFEKGRVDLVNIGGGTVGRLTLEPGWRWSVHVKPLAGTDLCEAPHFQYHASGVLRIQMADGSEGPWCRRIPNTRRGTMPCPRWIHGATSWRASRSLRE